MINSKFNGIFSQGTLQMYEIFTFENFNKNIKIPYGFKNLINIIYEKHNQTLDNVEEYNLTNNKYYINNNKDIIVGFSGGLDSCYYSLYLKDKGYNVILFHLKGLNKCYPKEDIFAFNFAKKNNFKYIEYNIIHKDKEFFIDNPLKNQYILSQMIDYGIDNNINQFALGDDLVNDIWNCKIGLTITDSKDVNELYIEGVKKYFPTVKLFTIDKNIKKYNRLEYILNNHNECLNDIYSCISPHRFNQMLHNNNQAKYNVKLLDGRCGSCYKCCMEILLLSELGYIYDKNKDKDLIEHCWKILSDSKNSHGKEKFNKKIPYDIRLKNLMEY